jgi:hypothetical protein
MAYLGLERRACGLVWMRLGLDVSWGRAAAAVAAAAAAGLPHSHPGTTCTQNSSAKSMWKNG